MAAYIVRRILQTIIVLLIVTFFSFMLMQLVPGDPILNALGFEAPKQVVQELRTELWLDKPVLAQYWHWLSNIVHWNFGTSIIYRNEEVSDLIAKRLPITAYIGSLAMIFGIVIAIPAGIITAIRRGKFWDSAITSLANLGVAVPIFWLGLLGIFFFGYKIGWLPIMGYVSPFEDLWSSLRHVIMPVICLAVVLIAVLVRQTRSSMLEVVRQDYIRTAWAKGLREPLIVRRHVVKNGIIPILTVIGIHIREIIGGSVLVETVFNIPGMGRLLVTSVLNKDFIVVQALVLVIAVVVSISNLVVDISYGWLDPRIRYD
jgi:peptide/nickel transport system permease protein